VNTIVKNKETRINIKRTANVASLKQSTKLTQSRRLTQNSYDDVLSSEINEDN
jgi:hypothetical protein